MFSEKKNQFFLSKNQGVEFWIWWMSETIQSLELFQPSFQPFSRVLQIVFMGLRRG